MGLWRAFHGIFTVIDIPNEAHGLSWIGARSFELLEVLGKRTTPLSDEIEL